MSSGFKLEDVYLPKWPAMVVVGKRVTPEQAAEIIIRTNGWWICSKYSKWEREVAEIAGLQFGGGSIPTSESLEPFEQRFGVLELEMLRNRRICSSWVGGAFGWCNWSGEIFCNNYNIGKYPSAESVLGEWETIAEAFPFLDLWCQLYSGETCEETSPEVRYVVKEGKAIATRPEPTDVKPRDSGYVDVYAKDFGHGCTTAQLREALKITEKSVKKKGGT